MKMYIPTIGDHIALTAPWTFSLYAEHRNESLYSYFDLPYQRDWRAPLTSKFVTLPEGAELGIDRIYIRRGGSDFDSITFNLLGQQAKAALGRRTRVRFWARLADVNKIEFSLLTNGIHLDPSVDLGQGEQR